MEYKGKNENLLHEQSQEKQEKHDDVHKLKNPDLPQSLQLTELRNECEKANKRAVSAESKLTQVNELVLHKDKEITHVKEEKERMRKEMEATTQTLNQVKETCEKLKLNLETYEKGIRSVTHEIRQIKAAIEKNTMKTGSAEPSIASGGLDESSTDETVQTLEHKSTGEGVQGEGKIEVLRHAVLGLKNQTDIMIDTTMYLADDTIMKNQKILEMEKETQDLKEQLENLKQETESEKKRTEMLEKLTEEVSKLQQEKSELKKTIDNISQKLTNTQTESNNYQRQLNELEGLKEKMEEKNRVINALKKSSLSILIRSFTEFASRSVGRVKIYDWNAKDRSYKRLASRTESPMPSNIQSLEIESLYQLLLGSYGKEILNCGGSELTIEVQKGVSPSYTLTLSVPQKNAEDASPLTQVKKIIDTGEVLQWIAKKTQDCTNNKCLQYEINDENESVMFIVEIIESKPSKQLSPTKQRSSLTSRLGGTSSPKRRNSDDTLN